MSWLFAAPAQQMFSLSSQHSMRFIHLHAYLMAHFRATLNEISSRCRFQGGLRIFRLPALPVPQVP